MILERDTSSSPSTSARPRQSRSSTPPTSSCPRHTTRGISAPMTRSAVHTTSWTRARAVVATRSPLRPLCLRASAGKPTRSGTSSCLPRRCLTATMDVTEEIRSPSMRPSPTTEATPWRTSATRTRRSSMCAAACAQRATPSTVWTAPPTSSRASATSCRSCCCTALEWLASTSTMISTPTPMECTPSLRGRINWVDTLCRSSDGGQKTASTTGLSRTRGAKTWAMKGSGRSGEARMSAASRRTGSRF
mmetsp:Transcript_10401/g.20827  ORF Transcript_10401/g.20827 Transcript_10401/m.20827 type:complete len:248 (-) Transcript_10401:1532-2275(-)